jgi:hypothetical protein
MEIHVPLLTVLPHCGGVCHGAKAAQAVNKETILLRVFAFIRYFPNNMY